MLANTRKTYALSDFTVEGHGDQWFYWKTARYGDKEERKGPYGSIASVTLMIATQLNARAKITMREIKFRAWDALTRTMFLFGLFAAKNVTQPDDAPVMQCTGLWPDPLQWQPSAIGRDAALSGNRFPQPQELIPASDINEPADRHRAE